jgi:hypothetical protein
MASQNAITHGMKGTKQLISASTTTAKATNAVGNYTNLVYAYFEGTAGFAYVHNGLTGDTATQANGWPIAFGQGIYFKISPGQFVHALLSTGTGTVHVIEVDN